VRCAYAACGLFVFPSSYEGFGIPILEAMAAGRPMVLSGIDVFREITQQQGVYFPPDDVQAMAGAMAQVLSSTTEQVRVVAYGEKRIKDFSYRSLAEQVKVLYESDK
jgi:glycosyltransferase involved in cell wall biosynthesis